MPPTFRPGRRPSSSNPLITDTVTVIKADGTRMGTFRAAVATGGILLEGSSVLIEVGDFIEQKLSNGATDTYEVLDPGYHENFGPMPAGYQMKTRKLGVKEAINVVSVTNNLHGANSRINNHSTDSSINVAVVNTQVADQIIKLREEINSQLTGKELKDALDLVVGIESEANKLEPNKSILKALTSALPVVGNIASIGGLLFSLVG